MVPAFDSNRKLITAAAPDGKRIRCSDPLHRVNSGRRCNTNWRRVSPQQVLRLDRYTRNLTAANTARGGAARQTRFTAPMYLLFERRKADFRVLAWLRDDTRKLRLMMTGYLDLVVSRVPSGPEILRRYSHELGYLILKSLTGGEKRDNPQNAAKHNGHRGRPEESIRPYENANLKLFTAMVQSSETEPIARR